MNLHTATKQYGFTLLELILVILIVGVLAVTTTPKWTSSSQSLQYQARSVLNDIRYAQAMSLTSGERYRWVRTSTTTYQVTNESGSPILLPNGSATAILTNGISFGSFTNLPSNLIAFDTQGAPYTTSSLPGTALASTATIQLISSSTTQSITITPTTGYGALS